MTEMTTKEAVAAGLFRWSRLAPGEGVILQCSRCGQHAHTSGLPAAYPGINGAPRHLAGNGREVWDWRERHACETATGQAEVPTS